MYLYRTINATAEPETAGGANPLNGIGAELAKLNSRIDAIESMTSGKPRETKP
jgi:hypothetical protein